MYTTVFITVATLLTASCNSAAGPNNNKDSAAYTKDTAAMIKKDTTSINGEWQLIPVLPSDTATGRVPTLSFDLVNRRFSGNTGCNSISGKFYTEADSLSFNEQIIMTKMACPGYNEQGFIESITNTNRWKIKEGVLQLMQGQTILSKWVRKNATVSRKI